MQTDYLIVGVGNTLRSDDGAGWALAQQLEAILAGCGATTELRLVQQLLPELAAEIAELSPAALVIADCTAQTGRPPLQRLEGSAGREAATALRSHGLAPDQLFAITVRLYEFSGSAWLATIPGDNFAHGARLSNAAQQAIAANVQDIAAQLLARVQPACTPK